MQAVGGRTGGGGPWCGGLSTRDAQKKGKLIGVMIALMDVLADGEERSVAGAAVFLKSNLGDSYADTLREQGFGKHLAEAIRLFPESFVLVKQGYYVRRV